MFPHRPFKADVAFSVLIQAGTSQNSIIWKIWSQSSVSQATVWIDMDKSPVFDRLFCCWFSQVIVSTPRGLTEAWQTDGAGMRAIVDSQKAPSLWKARREQASAGMGTHVYFISLPKCRRGEHMRETETEREGDRGQATSKLLQSALVTANPSTREQCEWLFNAC